MVNASYLALHKKFLSLAPVPPEEWEIFAQGLSVRTLAPGERFLEAGLSCHEVGFVVEGLLKSVYRTSEGSEYIRNFSGAGSFLAAMVSLLRNDPLSDVTVCALETSTIVVSTWENFRAGYQRHWTWQQLGRLFAEQNYLVRERRQYQLLTMSAEERFEEFLRSFPDLLGRLKEKDIAVYLRIRPESLSRLRARQWGNSKPARD